MKRTFPLAIMCSLLVAPTACRDPAHPTPHAPAAATTAPASHPAIETAIPFKYDTGFDFSEGLALVSLGEGEAKRYGFVDTSGKEVIPLRLQFARAFRSGLAPATLDFRKWGYIDRSGKFVLDPVWDGAETFREDRAVVSILTPAGFKYGVIRPDGTTVIAPRYDMIRDFSHGRAQVLVGEFQNGGRWGFIDRDGREVVPPRYLDVSWDFERYDQMIAKMQSGSKTFWVDIDHAGNPIPGGERAAVPKGIGSLVVEVDVFRMHGGDGLSLIIDETGARFIGPSDCTTLGPFEDARAFSEGLAPVKPKGSKQWGYIDRSGTLVVPPAYDDASPFRQGLAWVKKDAKWGAIRKLPRP